MITVILFAWAAGVASVWWQVKPRLQSFRILLALCSIALWMSVIALTVLGGNKGGACFESIGNTLPTGGA
jgi:predicted membrane channel-forming protein YqfA (hemolysin III family)